MAAKEVTARFKIVAPGGNATPGPPLGPALGANGVNPGQFIQQFNAATSDKTGQDCTCVITVYNDRSFEFEIKSSPAASLLKKAAGISAGSGTPDDMNAGSVTKAQIREIAQEKYEDLNAASIEAADRIIEGTARSMGLRVEG